MSERITPILMPKWGLSMREGKLAAWRVEEGETIAPGREIMDIETDKIANAVEAADAGLLRRRIGQEGEVYPVKALLGVLADKEVSDAEIDAYVANFVAPAADDEDEDESPAYRMADTTTGKIRYAERAGAGDPIVFIHGFGGDLNNWLFNIDAAASLGPVYALDLPGHGGSTKTLREPGLAALATAVEQFMDLLELKRASLVGHSLGGAIAATLALRRKDLVRSLTLINSAGLGEEINAAYIDGFVAAESRRDLKPVLQLLFANPDLVSRAMIEDLLKYKRLDGVQQALQGLASSVFPSGRQANVLAGDLAKAGMPTQIVWGAKDAIIPVAHARAVPGARVEIIEEAGHMAQMEAAARVNELIGALATG
jgi:pyruvate dehydrogenase E2 component (dihydrolipoamide acetyltransferase)